MDPLWFVQHRLLEPSWLSGFVSMLLFSLFSQFHIFYPILLHCTKPYCHGAAPFFFIILYMNSVQKRRDELHSSAVSVVLHMQHGQPNMVYCPCFTVNDLQLRGYILVPFFFSFKLAANDYRLLLNPPNCGSLTSLPCLGWSQPPNEINLFWPLISTILFFCSRLESQNRSRGLERLSTSSAPPPPQ